MRREVAKVVMGTAHRMVANHRNSVAGEMDRVRSYGVALLSLYCKGHALPGAAAQGAIRHVGDWHAAAKG